MDDPQNKRVREVCGGGGCKICTCACVINCQEESLAAWGSGQSSAVVAGPVSRHCLHPGCHLHRLSQHVSSQVQLLLVWVKIHPLRTPCRVLLWKHGWIFTQDVHHVKSVFFYYLIFCVFHKHTQSSASTTRKKVVDNVMKFLFCNWNIYWVTIFFNELGLNFHPLHTAKVNQTAEEIVDQGLKEGQSTGLCRFVLV